MLFEKDTSTDQNNMHIFDDDDYTEKNKNFQRVRNYSFVRN